MSSRELKKCLVFDENNQKLGQVIDYIINSDTLVIEQIIVRSSPSLQSLSPELIINRKQIVSIEPKKIIVENSGVKQFSFKQVQDFLFQKPIPNESSNTMNHAKPK